MDAGARDRLRRWLRPLLRAYPRNFRERYGRDLERTYLDWFRELGERGSRLAMARVLGLAFWHSMRDGLVERIAGGSTEREGTMEGVGMDVRMALRSLGKAPGFTAAAVIVLALGVGANVTAFSALRVTTLARPPFPEAERMVSVDLTRRYGDGPRRSRWAYPYLEVLEGWEDPLVEPVTAYRGMHGTLTEMGPASRVSVEMVSPAYFRVVGLSPALGRDFTAEEGTPGTGERVVIVSHAFWRTRLGGEPSAVGRQIRLNDARFQIVGVAPAGFRGLTGAADLWVPHGSYDVFQPGVLGQPGNHVAWVAGRLRPHAALDAAAEQMGIIGNAIARRWPRDDAYGAGLRPFSELWTNAGARRAAQLLSLAAALVLLVACANLSGLLLTRARRRARAGAVRRALGASRWRLVRASLFESFVLVSVGCAAAIAVAAWGTGMLARAWPETFLRGSDTGLRVVDPAALAADLSALPAAMAVSAVAALLIGVLPALWASSERITEHLKAATGAVGAGRRQAVMDTQSVLVGGQIALALVLVLGVAVLGKSVRHLLGVSEGFRTERLVTFDFSRPQGVPRLDLGDPPAWRDHVVLSAQFDDRMQERLTALPGIEAVAISGSAPLGGFNSVIGVTEVEGRPPGRDLRSVGVVTVDPRAFQTLGFSLASGRGFLESDGLQGPPVVVLNRRAIDLFFDGQDPVGRRFGVAGALPGRDVAEVVGVVEDVRYGSPDEEPWPVAYFSTRERRFGSHALVRISGDPGEAVGRIRNALHELDPTVAMSDVATMEERIRRSVGDRAVVLALLGVFGALTVLLVAVGTWAVVAYAVADRARELAVRVALGAERGSVVRLVVERMTRVAMMGGILGLAGGLVGTRVLEGFLFETSPHDPAMFLLGGSLLLVVVSLAGYVPARRATKVDPAQALRALE